VAKQKKLKKTWRKLRHATTHRLAICSGGELTILSEHRSDWWASTDPDWRPPLHISEVDLHAPDAIVGVYVEGPIYKGQKKSGRVFIDLCNDTVWSLINKKGGFLYDSAWGLTNEEGKILLHKKMRLIALHPGVIEPIIRSANHKLRELV
jgi:hypothetical protein